VSGKDRTTVIEVSGLQWATSKASVVGTLSRRPGVLAVAANPVAQNATVTYDPARTTVVELAEWVRECGYQCAGRSVPQHLCDPRSEPGKVNAGHKEHPGHETHAGRGADQREAQAQGPRDVMEYGGRHGGMSMTDMARDMRNRFLLAATLSVPILLWSPIGRDVFGFTVAAPFGLRDDVFSLMVSVPVIFYSALIFFDGALRALRARTPIWC
jgi:Cu2+-exporting ATPase